MRVKSLRKKCKRKVSKGHQRLGSGTCAQLVETYQEWQQADSAHYEILSLSGVFSETLISLLHMQEASQMCKEPCRNTQGRVFILIPTMC